MVHENIGIILESVYRIVSRSNILYFFFFDYIVCTYSKKREML